MEISNGVKILKILIVGCGSIGSRHLRNIKKITDCEIIVSETKDFDPTDLEKKYGIEVFRDYDTALNEKPDAVIISNPTAFHIEYALKAAKKGCHLFIEKPLSHNMNGVNDLIRVVEKKKLKVLIGCNLRFHRQLIKIKELLNQNAIGKVYFTRLVAGSYLPSWRPGTDYSRSYSARKKLGGGVVLDLIHEIDYAMWLFGEIGGLNANVCKLSNLEIDAEDYAQIFLKFKNATVAQIQLDYLNRKPSRSCEIVGEFGNIEWDYIKGLLKITDTKNKSVKDFSLDNYDINDMYIEEMKHFFNCVSNNEEPLVDIHDGKRALEIALEAKKVGINNIKKI